MTTVLADLAGDCSLLALRKVTRTPRAAGMMAAFYHDVRICQCPILFCYYLVVGETRVLEGVKVQQVGGFRRELNVLTLNKERIVVLDNGPNQISTHVLFT